MERIYQEQLDYTSTQAKQKEEDENRRKLNQQDRREVCSEVSKHSHHLDVESEFFYNIVIGQVTPKEVNV